MKLLKAVVIAAVISIGIFSAKVYAQGGQDCYAIYETAWQYGFYVNFVYTGQNTQYSSIFDWYAMQIGTQGDWLSYYGGTCYAPYGRPPGGWY